MDLQRAVAGLLKLEEMFTEPVFICSIEEFLERNLEYFTGGENTHRSFEIFEEYSETIDRKLDEFVEQSQISQEEVLSYCETIFDQDPYALTCFEYIVSALKFEDFLEMMLKRKEFGDWEEEEEEKEEEEEEKSNIS